MVNVSELASILQHTASRVDGRRYRARIGPQAEEGAKNKVFWEGGGRKLGPAGAHCRIVTLGLLIFCCQSGLSGLVYRRAVGAGEWHLWASLGLVGQ